MVLESTLMRLRVLLGVGSTMLALICPPACLACTSFCFQHDGHWIFGKNLDWMTEEGMVVVNKRNVSKMSYAEVHPARWVSEYGSVTFNQYGRELPMGGMNEAGLVIENMWLSDTEYPPEDHRAALPELQWIQYQLDTAASVEEVITSDRTVRIRRENSHPLHFLISDRKGACASIEFLDGEMVVHTGEDMPVTVLTNDTYDRASAFLARVDRDETGAEFQSGGWSLKRFVLAARGVAAIKSSKIESAIAHAFDILDEVSWGGAAGTQWRIVYDTGNHRIHFHTRSDSTIRYFDIDAFDFACEMPVQVLTLAVKGSGDVTRFFSPYSYKTNYELIRAAYSQTDFLKDIPDEGVRWMAALPESMICLPTD
jgi:choloylglycine hydrolase